MLDKNIVPHKIPGYRVPISAIWIVLKINIKGYLGCWREFTLSCSK